VDFVAGMLAPAEVIVGAFVAGVPRELVLGFVPLALIAVAVPVGAVGASVDIVPRLRAALAVRVGELVVIAVRGRVPLAAAVTRRVADCGDPPDETEAGDRRPLRRALPARPCVLPGIT
jgi:hypothetical protein